MILVYLLQKPRLKIEINADDKPNYNFNGKFVHLRVINKSKGILGGGTASFCRATLKVKNRGETSVFTPKWATKRDPIRQDTTIVVGTKIETRTTVDFVSLEEAKEEIIPPGESKLLDIALKNEGDTECYIHEPENMLPKYLTDRRRKPENKLIQGKYDCEATIDCSNFRQRRPFRFELDNDGSKSMNGLNLRLNKKSASNGKGIEKRKIWDRLMWGTATSNVLLAVLFLSVGLVGRPSHYFGKWAEIVCAVGLAIGVVTSLTFRKRVYNIFFREKDDKFSRISALLVTTAIMVNVTAISVQIDNLLVGISGFEYQVPVLERLATVVVFAILLSTASTFFLLPTKLFSQVGNSTPRGAHLLRILSMTVMVITILTLLLYAVRILTPIVTDLTIFSLFLSVIITSGAIGKEIHSLAEQE